jgi:hypothetical protein
MSSMMYDGSENTTCRVHSFEEVRLSNIRVIGLKVNDEVLVSNCQIISPLSS